ncbi:apolipoprotein L3-like [Ochotona princeps]|uniref:apolipoprotein L3-like n=1 Tax=Ochotona princeps TaxID=9978 RepID=UPI0027146ECD|nr:apolipoprotein L3-like [Ochotona princeps]XP_058529276.1 apolipoprotein L3-like [Ochotona princeps]
MESKEEDHGAAGGHEGDEQGDDGTMVPDAESRFADIIEYIRKALSREELQRLLAEDEAWGIFVSEAELSSEEAHTLREVLAKCITDMAMDSVPDKDPDMDLEDKEERQVRERFLKEFPQVKAQLEESIAKLHALADNVGKVHRDCTITNVVAASTGAASGILSLLGLALAPVTAGLSLALTVTGLGLRTAAALTRVTTTIVEHSTNLSAEEEAKSLMSSSIQKVEQVGGAVAVRLPTGGGLPKDWSKLLKVIAEVVRIIRSVRSSARLLTTGRIAVQDRRQVQPAFGDTAQTMTTGARITGAATAGLFLLVDVISLVQESVQLHQETTSESAQDLRQRAQQLEEKLAQLTEIHRSLQQDTAE